MRGLKIGRALAKRVWVGQLSQLEGYTVNETTLDIETLEMVASPQATLKKFIGRKLKSSYTTPIEVGKYNVFNQTVNLVLYYLTSLEKSAIEASLNAEDLFVIVESLPGVIEVLGLTHQEQAKVLTIHLVA